LIYTSDEKTATGGEVPFKVLHIELIIPLSDKQNAWAAAVAPPLDLLKLLPSHLV